MKTEEIIYKPFKTAKKKQLKSSDMIPTHLYIYKNAMGENIFCVARYEYIEFGKQKKYIKPWFWAIKDGCFQWISSWLISSGRPLYGLENLIQYPKKTVIVVEGEKCVDIAQELLPQYVFVTSAGGSSASKQTDWSPLNGREVIIWPDKDTAGSKYKNDVVQAAFSYGVKTVHFLMIPNKYPSGFDIADAIEKGWDEERIETFIKDNIKAAKKLSVLSLEELYDYKIRERKFYYPWLRAGSLNMVYARRGLGKTFFALGLVTALIQGNDFLNWKNKNRTGVLYIDGEMALTDVRTRLQMFLPKLKDTEPLELLSHEELYLTEERDLILTNREIIEHIKEYLLSNKDIKLVVLDNLSCLFPSLDEDTRKDWMEVVHPFLIWCRNNNISVLIVHHANKKGEQRGSSAKEDILDIVIELSPIPDVELQEGASFYVEFKKNRMITPNEVPALEVKLNKDGSWEYKEKEKAAEDMLYQLVLEGVESVSAAAEMMNLSEGHVSKLKKRLTQKGLLKNVRQLVLA